ncbi:hypothetical protein DFJ73DRAFT_655932 [Zopfochytrium polystomum]|nr:hypothetical protein DFJ73DRAFT_655932 [Zopfochytrium polystomum]
MAKPHSHSAPHFAAAAVAATTLTAAAAAAAAAAAYLVLVRLLRYRRLNAILSRFGARDVDSLSPDEIRDVCRAGSEYEFPFMGGIALQMALLRTYAIPKISTLLASTGQLCGAASSSASAKRLADTSVALIEALQQPDDSPAGNLAVARVNWLHEHYKKHIDRDGMVYTLSVFVTEPTRYIERYEWRARSRLERECYARYWHRFGLKMGIVDPPRTYDEFVAAQTEIEGRLMRFHPDNARVATASVETLLQRVAPAMRPFARANGNDDADSAVAALLPPPPSARFVARLKAFLAVRQWFVRHCMLPRLWPRKVLHRSEALDSNGGGGARLFLSTGVTATYERPTVWNRWGPAAWLARLAGMPLPGDPGQYGDGCSVEDLGPVAFEGKGHEAVRARAEELARGEFRTNVWV